MKEYMELNGRKYEIAGYAEDGLPILKAQVTTTEDGVDEDGNPKRSVRVFVPSTPLRAVPGEVK